jgi:hypothetical protein
MPTATADQQDIAGVQVTRHTDTTTPGASVSQSFTFNGVNGINDTNGPASPSDRERKEVRPRFTLWTVLI